jgi:hypothetical protein
MELEIIQSEINQTQRPNIHYSHSFVEPRPVDDNDVNNENNNGK